ncbi:bone morphogenetic protein receptor type-2-like [Genypterus blacodes]|uniref:bone morphogenetic protein receptor type-2-like n=1 Tax=Genypterus blacodes TaxID=154954 RepID=UPI003F76BAFC
MVQVRRCAFKAKPKDIKYRLAGNVSGSEQLCANTHCCVGYFGIVDGLPEASLLACDVIEMLCAEATCKPQSRFDNTFIKCVCNTDLCNSNITWELEQPQLVYSYTVDVLTIALVVLSGTLLVVGFILGAVKCLSNKEKKNLQPSHQDDLLTAVCSCHTTKTCQIDSADFELQQIVCCGHFATVWQGTYQGTVVAVKVFPTGRKETFITEREVYELPLMKHDSIIHFLGEGTKLDGCSGFLVLEFAEYGSLHSYLCQHTGNWMWSLKLCHSLSQGLSYLHTDLCRNDVHKPAVAHRDLSSSNVLVKADGTCALSDFGCSTILRSCLGHHHWQSFIRNMVAHTQVGTLRYMSPEILEGSVNLSNSWCLMQGDVYALGLLLWEIWMRCTDLFEGSIVPEHLLPYESELGATVTLENLVIYVSHMDNRPSIPKHWDLLPQGSSLQELVTGCWDRDPDARLTSHCVVDRFESLLSSVVV